MPIVKDTFDILATGWQWVGRFGFPLIGAMFSLRVGFSWITGETIRKQRPSRKVANQAVPHGTQSD